MSMIRRYGPAYRRPAPSPSFRDLFAPEPPSARPRKRARTLKLVKRTKSHLRRKFQNEQTSNHFSLLKLPLEIRLMIYHEVATASNDGMGRVVHIFMDKLDLIQYSQCYASLSPGFLSHRQATSYYHRLCTQSRGKRSTAVRDPATSLKLTCRQIQAEVKDLFYQHTTFDFTTYFAPRRFHRPFPTHHFNRIHHLSLNLTISIEVFARGYQGRTSAYATSQEYQRIARWRIMWEQISRMPSLTSLDVRIGDAYGLLHHTDAESEQRILEPLCNVRRLERFRVYVGWYLAMWEEEERDTPFTEFTRGLNWNL